MRLRRPCFYSSGQASGASRYRDSGTPQPMSDIPGTPRWLNWLAALCGIFGVTIFGVIGWIIGNMPSVRVRPKPSRQRQQSLPCSMQVHWMEVR